MYIPHSTPCAGRSRLGPFGPPHRPVRTHRASAHGCRHPSRAHAGANGVRWVAVLVRGRRTARRPGGRTGRGVRAPMPRREQARARYHAGRSGVALDDQDARRRAGQTRVILPRSRCYSGASRPRRPGLTGLGASPCWAMGLCFVLFCWVLSYDLPAKRAGDSRERGVGTRRSHFEIGRGGDSTKLRFGGSWSGSAPEPG